MKTKFLSHIIIFKIKQAIIHLSIYVPLLKFNLIKFLRSYYVQKQIRDYWKKSPNKKNGNINIIIFGLRTYERYDLAVFEKILTDFLIYNGASIKNLLCMGFLKSCDGAIYGESDKVLCIMCKNQKRYFKRIYPNNYIYLSDFINSEEIRHIENIVSRLNLEELINYEFMDVHIGKHAIDSVKKYFRNEILDKNNPLYIQVLRHNVKQGILLVQIIKNLLEKEKPTHFITLHGGYSTWGPIADYLGMHGVTVYLHNKALNRVGCYYITKAGEALADIVAKEEWNKFKNIDLNEDKKNELRLHMTILKEGKTTEYKTYNDGRDREIDTKLLELLDNKEKPKYALYTHLLWDKCGINRYDSLGSIFNDDYEWMIETIGFFINNNYLLFIKPHPGENLSAGSTIKGIAELILAHFGDLPENITIISRSSPITSFKLMDKGCIGIVYTSTVGLEHSYFKKPVLVAGDIHYARAGATHRIKSKEEYFELIKDSKPLYKFIEEKYDIIEKYAYYYYFKQQVRIPFYRDDIWLGHCIDWQVLRDYKRFIESDKIMNSIAKSIINKHHVMNID